MAQGNRVLLLSALFVMAACASNEPDSEGAPLALPDFESMKLASCPEGAGFVLPERISLTASPIGWGEGAEAALSPFRPVSVFELTSDNARFGGLSGLDMLDDNTFLSVSDSGEMVWFDFEDDAPASSAYLGLLRGADGQPLQGKSDADAEGVAWNGEYAFVSFERNHRILGFDIEGCGSNARGIEVVRFEPTDFNIGPAVKPNSGMEALAVFGDGLLVGLETRLGNSAVYAHIAPGKAPKFEFALPAPEVTQLVSLDTIFNPDGSGRLYALTRSYDPMRGNRIGIVLAMISPGGEIGEAKVLKTFGKEVSIDNFEGITVQYQGDGTDRLFLISDNNFSDRQRNLFGVLDYSF